MKFTLLLLVCGLLTACAVVEPTPWPATATFTATIPEISPTATHQTPLATAVTATPPATPTAAATATAVPPTPTATVTAVPTTPTATTRAFAPIDATTHPPGTAVPPPAPLFAKSDDITNIILLGNDVDTPQGGRTDSLILLSINRSQQTATMLSLPRDLYVVIPDWRMTKINLALPHGHGVEYPGGGGGLIRDTIEYNLGIPVDHYVRIGFGGFKTAVDAVGGIEMVVNCPLTDWRLISPELDPTVEENWAQFTLEPGIHQMDGDLALWYARSRRTTNDFERGLRQQRVLQAIVQKGLSLDLLTQAPELWAAYKQHVETDLTLAQLIELGTLAPAVEANGIQHLALPYSAVRSWQAPDGSSVQLLQWAEAEPLLRRVMAPPLLDRASHPALRVAVVTDDYILYRQMADNLAWLGFVPQYEPANGETPNQTEIVYYGRNRKGSYDWLLSWAFQRTATAIQDQPDSASEVDYRVTLGYDADPCLSYLNGPQPEE
jgi:LCP family protein required for cell wall assembly